MIEAVYLMDSKPNIPLFTISIKEMTPMTIGLSPKVKQAIPETIEQILKLTEKLHAEIA